MCGILGQFAWGSPLAETGLLWGATQMLAHRGPDGGGFWAEAPFFLGHRRLAIIDLSPAGAQPMRDAEDRFVVTFNGEIYNHIELRAELEAAGHVFHTRSDTEVLLAGYRAWGTGLPARLRGMFAFAIVDRREATLFVARDRFGEKPLFLHHDSGRVTFASQVAPLAAITGASGIDREALGAFMCLNYVPGERTLLEGVTRLAPGAWRLYRRDGVREERFWTPRGAVAPSTIGDLDAAADAAAAAIDESVRIALRADVPIALFLSGGIDSSLVAESACRQGRLETAYCVDFEDARFSEWDGAARVASRLGLKLERVPVGPSILDSFDHIVAQADDPLADSSALPMWALSQAVARDYKVAISGDGGDELFGGYLTYRATALHARWIARLPDWSRAAIAALGRRLPASRGKVSTSYKLRRFLRAADLPTAQAHFSWNGAWLPEQAAALLRDPEAKRAAATALAALANRSGLGDTPDLTALQCADIGSYLADDILVKVDRTTMAHGLEARAPLLTPEIAAIGLSLPERLRADPAAGTKLVLRRLATRRLGAETGEARKQGFSIPIHDWLSGPGRGLLMDALSPEAIEATGLLDCTRVIELRDRHLARRDALGFELWGLMVLTQWCRQRREATPPAVVGADELSRHHVQRNVATPLA
jgi:asparagine synthase (glutamine-hydrolysing)